MAVVVGPGGRQSRTCTTRAADGACASPMTIPARIGVGVNDLGIEAACGAAHLQGGEARLGERSGECAGGCGPEGFRPFR